MASTRTYVRGTLANLLRGVAPALINFVLPIVLVGVLAKDEFSSWSLAMSLTAYVVVLQLGIYQAVTAVASPKRQTRQASTLTLPLAAAVEFLTPLMVIAALIAVVVVVFAPSLFPAVPSHLLGDFDGALLLLTAAAIANQYSAAGWGFALGVDDLGGAMASWVLGRVVSVVAAVALAVTTSNILWVGVGFTVPVLVSLPVQLRASGLTLSDFAPEHRRERRRFRRGYTRAAKTLVAHSVGALMVAGLDGPLVGHFDFAHAGVFLFSASVVLLFVGFIGSWTASYLAHAPALSAPGAADAIPRVGRLTTAVNLFLAAASAMLMWPLLTHLFDRGDARIGYAVFVVLIAANAFRQWTMPAMLSALAGQHYARLVRTGLSEGVSNLVSSFVLCALFGAVGVALGTLVGALVTVPVVLLYTFRDPVWARLGARRFAAQALVRPVGALLVPTAVALLAPFVHVAEPIVLGVQLMAIAVAAVAGWRYCVDPAERLMVRSRLHRTPLAATAGTPVTTDDPVTTTGIAPGHTG